MVTWSYGSYVIRNDDGDLLQRSATWARNHRLGMFVDRIEEWRYSKPPSTDPANELGFNATDITVESTVPPTSTLPPELSVEPENIAPVVTPALTNEGVWVPIAEITDGTAVAWATSIRPLADHASVVATFVTIDQENLVAGLFNGYEMPGGDWVNGERLEGAQVPAAVATFNGGFRFEHYKGGYFTEGKMLRELRDGEATFAIGNDGKVLLGEYGRDMTNDGSWKSLRQNLPLMIDGGEDILDKNPGVNWGEDYHDKIYVLRSAVCQQKSGALLYAIVGEVDVRLLVRALLVAGCERAMQLDINGLAGSGGDMFPWLFKHNKLGPVIGTRTWGGLVGISGNPGLIDGGSISVPTFGFYESDGTWGVEGHGIDPTLEVLDDPAKKKDGGDPQLEKAVEVLLEQIGTGGHRPVPQPKGPDRSGMGLPSSDK